MRILATVLLFAVAAYADWSQFRGPNASGVSETTGLPIEFGPNKNVLWKTPLPPGHSSPVLTADRIFVTALEGEKLFVFCHDRASGRILWRREVPRDRKQEMHQMNHPASPSPVTDGKNVYVFFADSGLISYGPDGNERWRLKLGPFNNPFGMGASPVLAGSTLLQNCDAETGSFFVAVDKDTGKELWRTDRSEHTRGFSTPVLYKPPDSGLQAIIAGSGRLTAYAVDTGKPVWWVNGLTWQLKPTPVIGEGVIYVLGWAGGADIGQQEAIPPFEVVLKRADKDKDGKLSKEEIPDPALLKGFKEADLDGDGYIGERDWDKYRERRSSVNAVTAVRLGGSGDVTDKNILWRYYKSLPNVPSPLLYKGVLYLAKEGGIVTSLDPSTGDVLKQGRLMGALDQYFSSPVGADGKVYIASQAGHVSVLKAAGEWEILAVNEMHEEIFATPAIDSGRMYVRTRSALYCIGDVGGQVSGAP